MTKVSDIHAEALKLQKDGLSPKKIADRLVDLGHDSGFSRIQGSGATGGGKPTEIQLTFPTGEAIHFDGKEWCYNGAKP